VKAISNAGPLIALAKLGQLGLLLKLFDEIVIPREVYNEVVTKGLLLGAPDAESVDYLIRQGHIFVKDVTLPTPVPEWAKPIDMGEAQVLLLALNQSADWVVVDSAHARKAARGLGLPLKGTIGLLLEALRKCHLSLQEFELLIHTIKSSPSLWISASICDKALIYARKTSRSSQRAQKHDRSGTT
jgi:predicted nucleic acid-binding protein